LEGKYNKTSNSTQLVVQHAFSVRAEVPQAFGKFGAIMESDGADRLWISSGWANEEDGVVWSYNVTDGLSNVRSEESREKQGRSQEVFRTLRKDVDEYKAAEMFAEGTEPKVSLVSRLTHLRRVSGIHCLSVILMAMEFRM